MSSSEATDAILTSTIARMASRLEILTNDIFVSTALTFELRGDGTRLLNLPQRCTAVATVKTRDPLGNLTTQTALSYRLVSSLDAAGADRVGYLDQADYLEIVPYQFLTGIVGEPWWIWPQAPKAVQVVGTFGWTVTPYDISRAVALMVNDSLKPQANILRRAVTFDTVDARTVFGPSDAAHPTGLTDVDQIIGLYRRSDGLLVG